MIKNLSVFIVFVVFSGLSASLKAQTTSLEVGEGVLPAFTTATGTTLSPFTRITFASPFNVGVTPNVFTMTPEFGVGAADDPCTIRIRNVDNTGFDAACLEPINEDRDSPGLTFEYIAIQPGGVTVPLVGGGGNVQFESQCRSVSQQVFGPNCVNCLLGPGQSQGYQTVGFATSFTNPPALLTQIQTTNNTVPGGGGRPGGEPEFLDTGVRNLGSADFQVTLDRMEAGNGVISSGETICYLAVERAGCQELDFSSLSGPSSVMFEAVFGGNVDGHGNGATTGEGASFSAGCFSSTPVALAKQRSRAGNNGGFLRRASINASEIILTYDEDRVSDDERNHIDEQVSALAFSQTFTTPVTMAKVLVTQFGRKTVFDWQTSAETFHLGFHLWGETRDGWVQLNRRMVANHGGDTDLVREYRQTVRLDRNQFNEIQRFGISSVDNSGYEEFYGPFELDVEYGESANTEPVDWAATRQRFERSMRQRGYYNVNNRWRRLSSSAQSRLEQTELGVGRSSVNLRFSQSGIHRVSARKLLALNPKWAGAPLSSIAVSLNGKAVPRDVVRVNSGSQGASGLSVTDEIVFFVKSPQGRDSIYLSEYNYQLSLDRSKAVDASDFDGRPATDAPVEEHALIGVEVTSPRAYSPVMKADEPWFDRALIAVDRPASASYSADFEPPINTNLSAQLDVVLFGGITLAGDQPDHHIQIRVNGKLVDDARFDGLNIYRNKLVLPAGLVKQTNNLIEVIVPGDTGLFADRVLIDELVLWAPSELTGRAKFDFPSSANASAYQLSLLETATPALVYAHTQQGALSKIKADDSGNQVRFAALPSVGAESAYTVAPLEALPEPADIRLANAQQLHRQASDLLIIAHPNFIGPELRSYADLKAEQGYSPRIVNWLEIVDTYGFGNNTPKALEHFLQRASEQFTPQNILLVGGHTYDYLGVLDENIVNFIPTHYRTVGIVQFAPSDNGFADMDDDNIPELNIGRWPVRNLDDLSAIIKKSKSWGANRDASPYQSALLIAQQNDNRNLSFENTLNGRIEIPLSEFEEFEQLKKVYLQELVDQGIDDVIGTAQKEFADAINNGVELLSFAGHGSASSWGFQGIVNTDFIKNLRNIDKPMVVMPLACHTTNYESPSVNTLAHQWLFAGEQGAVAIHGASVLGEYRENGVFAERYLRSARDAKTIGGAIRKAKNEMVSSNQMLHNWALLGDPTLPLR